MATGTSSATATSVAAAAFSYAPSPAVSSQASDGPPGSSGADAAFQRQQAAGHLSSSAHAGSALSGRAEGRKRGRDSEGSSASGSAAGSSAAAPEAFQPKRPAVQLSEPTITEQIATARDQMKTSDLQHIALQTMLELVPQIKREQPDAEAIYQELTALATEGLPSSDVEVHGLAVAILSLVSKRAQTFPQAFEDLLSENAIDASSIVEAAVGIIKTWQQASLLSLQTAPEELTDRAVVVQVDKPASPSSSSSSSPPRSPRAPSSQVPSEPQQGILRADQLSGVKDAGWIAYCMTHGDAEEMEGAVDLLIEFEEGQKASAAETGQATS